MTNGSGGYSGSGFGSGIAGYSPQNARVSGVSVSGCLYYGIFLSAGDSTVVDSCTVRTVGGNGIVASTIKASVAKDCGGTAIFGDQVADCRGESAGSGSGLHAITALNCYGYSYSGIGLEATTAQNCYGYSYSGNGLNANTALNCYGTSSSSIGLNANAALNCQGSSSSSSGLNAYIANSSYGESSSSIGLSAYYGNFCFGTIVSVGTKYNMPP